MKEKGRKESRTEKAHKMLNPVGLKVWGDGRLVLRFPLSSRFSDSVMNYFHATFMCFLEVDSQSQSSHVSSTLVFHRSKYYLERHQNSVIFYYTIIVFLKKI